MIEDDDDIRALLVRRLIGFGYQSAAAATGEQALRLAATRPPDVVVLDLGLPDIHGWEVARRLKRRRATEETPIVVVSASDEEAPLDVAVAARVTKPFTADEVERAVTSVLRGR